MLKSTRILTIVQMLWNVQLFKTVRLPIRISSILYEIITIYGAGALRLKPARLRSDAYGKVSQVVAGHGGSHLL